MESNIKYRPSVVLSIFISMSSFHSHNLWFRHYAHKKTAMEMQHAHNHTASQWSVWYRNSYLTASQIFPLLTTSGLRILRQHQTTTILTADVDTDVQLTRVLIFRIKVSGFYMVSTTKQVVAINLQMYHSKWKWNSILILFSGYNILTEIEHYCQLFSYKIQ